MQIHPDYTSKASPFTVPDSVNRLTALMTEHGITVFTIIDQAEAARKVGLELRDTVLIVFGNPGAGTPVMEAQPLSALDLPLKLLVWDDGGRTLVSYLKPVVLSARYGLTQSLVAPLGGFEALVDAVLAEPSGATSSEP